MTWSQGPQVVGFAMWHIHPGFALIGVLCSLAILVWLLITVPYAIVRRRDIGRFDWVMMASSLAVVVVLAIPDAFFASSG